MSNLDKDNAIEKTHKEYPRYDLEDGDIEINKEYTLTCPYGEDHTHHYKTICYCRDQDERAVIIEIDMYTGEVFKFEGDIYPHLNPSDRRQAVSLFYKTENDRVPHHNTIISQHKGKQYLTHAPRMTYGEH